MTLFKNNFEGTASGTSLATGQAGSGDSFNSVAPTNGSTMVYDNTRAMHGTQSLLITPSSTGQARFDYSASSATAMAAKAYVYLTAAPTADTYLVSLLNTAAGRVLSFSIGSSGRLRIFDGSGGGTAVWTAAATMPLNQWVRLELYGVVGGTATTGTVKAAAYLGDATTPIETVYLANGTGNMGTTALRGAAFGKYQASSPYATAFWMDDVAVNDAATDFIGLGGNTAPTVTAGAAASVAPNAAFSLPFTATDAEGDTLTRTATAVAGNPATLGTLTVSTTAVTGTAPATPGKYLINLNVSDGSLSNSTQLVLYVTSTAGTPYAVLSNTGGWAASSGTIYGALADADTATFVASPDNPAGATFGVTVTPYTPGATARVSYAVSQNPSSPARTVTVGLYMNNALIASKTETLTTSILNGFFDLTAGQLSSWTDRNEPEIRFIAN